VLVEDRGSGGSAAGYRGQDRDLAAVLDPHLDAASATRTTYHLDGACPRGNDTLAVEFSNLVLSRKTREHPDSIAERERVAAHRETIERERARLLEEAEGAQGDARFKLRSHLLDDLQEVGRGEAHRRQRSSTRRSTPRWERVRELIDSGHLLYDEAVATFPQKVVTDAQWELLSKVDLAVRPDPREVPVGPVHVALPKLPEVPPPRTALAWRLAHHRPGSSPRYLVEDGEGVFSDPFPVNAVAAALTILGQEGWDVVHASEDRGVDDRASRSRVVSARFLLRRRTSTHEPR
jgi:hypothetical protein